MTLQLGLQINRS